MVCRDTSVRLRMLSLLTQPIARPAINIMVSFFVMGCANHDRLILAYMQRPFCSGDYVPECGAVDRSGPVSEPKDPLQELVEDELFAEAFEVQRELNRVREEMESEHERDNQDG